MLKIIERILLVVMIAALFSTGVYYLVNSVTSQSQSSFEGGTLPSLDSDNGQHGRQGASGTGIDREGKGDTAFSGAAWLDILKNLLLISVFTVAIVLIRKVLTPKGLVEKIPEIN